MWKYRVIYGLGVRELTANVNQALREGWSIEGSLAVVSLGTSLQMFQTMVLYVDDQGEVL
jgi:hypothetical protein